MSKKLLLLLAVLVGVFIYSKNDQNVEVSPQPALPTQETLIQADRFSFRCDGRQHCSQMTSYEEAKFFLENCPNTKMDGDNDGIPCERQF
ncbi:conserved protein of unknown function [Alteromonas macleodii]|uniref:Excalibur calcium-binding domain-containing protein n=1 Tax=Alteromonas macleodii TaxID=28108 RepID=A0A6T9XWD5_ALTMA|nr:excalibur calcium-binding domain-containing protein [Alteromonas macleodii]CAB9492595.1 conserved protein of unknown function [Alteromonas macleodii]